MEWALVKVRIRIDVWGADHFGMQMTSIRVGLRVRVSPFGAANDTE